MLIRRIGGDRAGWIALAVALIIPLPTLVMQGMEHPLQILLWLTLLWRLPQITAGQDRALWPVLALLSVATRYEAAFGVAGVAVLLVERGRWRVALTGLAAGAAPILLYGLWLKAQGWPFFPAGAQVKTAIGQPSAATQLLAALMKATENFYYAGPLLVLVAIALGWGWQEREGEQRGRAVVAGIAAILHIGLAGFGHAFRYEAWIYAGLMVTLVPMVWEGLRRGFAGWLPGAMAVALMALGLGQRAGRAWWDIPKAAGDIARQQGVMAAYAAAHHRGEVVVANDIGLLAWEGGVRVLDIAGLGSREILEMRRAGLGRAERAEEIGRLAREKGARVAMVYPEWLGEVPEGWRVIGEWTVEEWTVLGGGRVVVYEIGG